MTERTLLFIKPDAVRRKLTGRIIDRIESSGLTIVDLRMVQLDQPRAEKFYEIHRGKPFFDDLMTFIISGPIVACLIEGDDCVRKIRAIIGATDPAQAAPGTVRKLYGTSITQNCVHASNPDENPAAEISFFFP